MADEAEAAPPAGQAEYDYNALLAKVDESIAETQAETVAPVPSAHALTLDVTSDSDQPSTLKYLFHQHSVLSMYTSAQNGHGVPVALYILCMSVVVPLLCTLEMSVAGTGLGLQWFIAVLVWQLTLLALLAVIASRRVPMFWPWIANLLLVVLVLWDLGRCITLPKYAISSGLGGTFLVWLTCAALIEPLIVVARHRTCWRLTWITYAEQDPGAALETQRERRGSYEQPQLPPGTVSL